MEDAVSDEHYDAVVLAAAGVIRLGLEEHISQWLPLELMLPAPGQGALAVQCRADDEEILDLLAAIEARKVRACVTAERAFLNALGGGCATPVAAYAQVEDGQLLMSGLVAAPDGSQRMSSFPDRGPDLPGAWTRAGRAGAGERGRPDPGPF